MKKIVLLFMMIFLCSCATMGTVQSLPAGSNIAIISSLDNRITYDNVGTTLFNNKHFSVVAPHNNPQDLIISSIKTELMQKGNHVIVIRNKNNDLFTKLYAWSDTLTEAQKSYLNQLILGKNIQRIILISKTTPFIDNVPTDNAIGYGYLHKEFLGFQRTLVFGAVSIAVIDTNDMKIHSLRNSYLYEKSNNDNWVNDPNQHNSSSLVALNLWFKDKYVPALVATLAKMGL